MYCHEGGYLKQFYFREEREYSDKKTYIDYVIHFSIIPPPSENGCYVNVWHEKNLISTIVINLNTQNNIKKEGWGIATEYPKGIAYQNRRSHYRIFNRALMDRNNSKSGIS